MECVHPCASQRRPLPIGSVGFGTPGDHPVGDFFKPVGIGMVSALVIFISMVFAAKYDIHLDKIGIVIIVGVVVLLAMVWTPVSNWLSVSRAEHRAKRGKEQR